MQFTTADGVELFYELEGNGEPLVLLNGIMMTTRSWTPVLSALTPRFRCILHDFRGQLRSPHRGPLNIEQHADDLVALLDHIGIERAHIAGTSYGGEVGMIFAYSYPERVKSLTVIASTSRADERMRIRTEEAMHAALGEHDRLYDIVARDFFSPHFLRAHPEVMEQGRARLASYDDDFYRGYASLCDAFIALDVTGNLTAIQCPTLVIAAEHDSLKPMPFSEVIAANIPGARRMIIEGAGHAVVVEDPSAVSEALIEFIG